MAEHEKGANKAAMIHQLVNSMTQELNYYWSLGEDFDNGPNSCLIYKVQQHIREIDKFSYQPLLVSIGPYHHGSAASMDFERVKWRFLDYVLKLNCDKNLLDFLTALGELAKRARHCYSEDVKMNNEEFLEMLLLDGCLILVGLGGTNNMLACRQEVPDPEEITAGTEGSGNLNYAHEDATSSESKMTKGKSQNVETEAAGSSQQTDNVGQWFITFMNHDLLLLENQIPYFIVEKIYELISGKDCTVASCSEEFAKYREAALRCYPKAIQESDRPKHFHHLLHLSHFYFRPTQRPEEELHHQAGPQFLNKIFSFGRKYMKIGRGVEDIEGGLSLNQDTEYLNSGQQLNRWRRAAQYLEAGIKFKKRQYDKLDPHSVLDVKFGNGVMEIPCHVIDEYTGTLQKSCCI